MTKHELVCQRLDELKGVLLLDQSGQIYLLKGYNVEDVFVKDWLFRDTKKKLHFISQIHLSSEIVHLYKVSQFDQMLRQVNTIIADRKRYLTMLRALSKIGYTIKKK